MDGLLNLNSIDTFISMGKICHACKPIKDLDPRTLVGKVVNLDGNPYEVLGVETFAMQDATGTRFAIRGMYV